MGWFDNAGEEARKANLKKMEDKRLAFADELAKEGFAPESMLFAQTANGGFATLSRFNGQYCLILSPGFGSDEDFVIERYDELVYRIEDVHVKSEGMGGIFGFGKKAEIGIEYVITRRDGSEARMPFVGGRSSWLQAPLAKNPLLKRKRRRGNANVAWDLRPLDKTTLEPALKAAAAFFPPQRGATGA